jgi:hypothetical protein
MSNFNRGPSIDASYPVLDHLAKWFQKRRVKKNQPIRNRNRLWQPCMLTDRNEMRLLYRGSSIDASYQVLVHMAKQFQRRIFFRNRPIRNKNCMWWPCLLTDQDEMSILHRGHSIDASYQVSLVAMFANRSGRNEQSS